MSFRGYPNFFLSFPFICDIVVYKFSRKILSILAAVQQGYEMQV